MPVAAWGWAARLLTLGGRFVAFRDELQGAAEYSEAGLPLLGAIIEELVAKPVAAFTAGHRKGIRLIASGRLATLSSWMVSVKAGHGDECSYLERRENSSQPHLVDRIVFCVFLEVDFKIYKKKMNEFFPVGDNNEEEDVDMKEYSDENGPEEKQSAEEIEGQSQEAGGINTSTVPSPISEEALEVCNDEVTTKDDNTKEDEIADLSVYDQDHHNGQEDDPKKNEIKIETEPQSSYMETEEFSSIEDDARIVTQPEVIPIVDDPEVEERKEAQTEETPSVPVKSEGSREDTEEATGPDVEMNSRVDSINEPAESQQED
ncbi:ADP-ribose glycohydrolase MACROD2 [Echinops telfairi]|uniref:ADP-ribose glycohydrolase MACROD2 n=1 Tax=Echinops telfairi TaxID=9371 RepID=A0AC55DH82_ECHTE|nr:ADP-ribose glycohydrolase MACROD2 [Echinops telfairi]